ncbi:Phenylalanine--tRNA ligase beta subunit [Candidatus Tiddalikarchaeum anstoanum]|nr:Phenylalanine--tRNA ligase beta subunit [Candidatus Tiddalikarchaeum anstoanum]
MPNIEVSFKEFQKLIGKKLPKNKDKLWDITQFVKCEVDDIEGDNLKLELQDTNRPDLWNETGIARELRGALNIETGLKKYDLKKSDKVLVKNGNVKKIRPFIAAAIAKNVKFDDYQIKQLIQLQDKLDTTHGRNRKKSAIGIYDYDKIKFPVFYKAVDPKSVSFIPLGFTYELNLLQILKEHPKGIEFGDLIKEFKKYPLLVDSADNVLSMPPIINSNHLGKVTGETKNVFIEVTGTDYRAVLTAVNIVSSYLAEKGADIESVSIKSGRKTIITPNFAPTIWNLNNNNVIKRLGLVLSQKDSAGLLEKARYGIKKINKDTIIVEVPFYRTDIMHDFDLVEDIGIMYGYKNIESESLKTYTIGGLTDNTLLLNKIRELSEGLGYQEVLTYTRCDKEGLFNKDCVEIANPIGEVMNSLRNELLPMDLSFLSKNTHNEYPQRIFEAGPVLLKDKRGVIQEDHLAILDASAGSDFTTIKQVVEWLMNNLKLKFEIKNFGHEAFIPGRCAEIFVNGKAAGYFGEIHPSVLAKFNLEIPITAVELNIEKLK